MKRVFLFLLIISCVGLALAQDIIVTKAETNIEPIAMAGGLTIASIGHYRMDNAHKVYNESCAIKKEPVLSMNLGVTRNGIGLTIHF